MVESWNLSHRFRDTKFAKKTQQRPCRSILRWPISVDSTRTLSVYPFVHPTPVDQSKRRDLFNPSDCAEPEFTALQPFAASVECTFFCVIMHAGQAFAVGLVNRRERGVARFTPSSVERCLSFYFVVHLSSCQLIEQRANSSIDSFKYIS